MSSRKRTIQDERWKKLKSLGLLEGRKPKEFNPALKKRMYRYAKKMGDLYDRAGKERNTGPKNKPYKVRGIKVNKKQAKEIESTGRYTVVSQRKKAVLIIDRPKYDRIRVKNIGGKTVIQEYRPYGKSRGGKRKVYTDITSSLNPVEFYRAAVEGNLDLPENASIQLVIGDNAPFNRVFYDAESASYYLANFLGIDVPENYNGPIMEPKSDDVEELIPLIQITIY